jgi:DNA-binding transcriptional MerR regulator
MGQRQLDPHKRYYRIREASAVVGVPAYVLRFWERQFPALRPQRAASGHRLYRPRDLELLLQIKHLLHEQHFTIAGARKVLKTAEPPAPADTAAGLLDEVRRELRALRQMLDRER